MTIWVVYPHSKIDVSYRNCMEVAKLLNAPFVDSAGSLLVARATTGVEYPDVVFSPVFIALLFSDWRDEYIKILSKSKRIIGIRSEYRDHKNLNMDLKYFRPTDEVWTSIKYICDDKRYFYLNWNRSAATPETKQAWKPSRDGLFYYGMCRPDRLDLLKEYFGPQVSYPVRVVSSKSDISNWAKINKGIQFSLYNEPKTFNIFNMTIYMIDKWMEDHDCSVARRFYENFNNGVPMLFDRRAIKQLENEKIMVHDSWVIDNHIDVTKKLPDYVTIQRKQQEYYGTVNWYGRFVKDFKYLAKQRGL